MTNRTVKTSPQVYARTAGVLYLINIACGLFGEIFVRGHLVVAGDALTTAHRIMSSEFLFRCGVAGDLIMHITDVPMAQLQALASLSLAQHEYGFGIGLVFFGVSCLVTAYLLFRSGYFPRTLGVLQAMAGVSYLINSFAQLLSPSLANKMFPAIVLPAFIGELGTCVWLIVKGVNVSKWDERVRMGPVIESPTGE